MLLSQIKRNVLSKFVLKRPRLLDIFVLLPLAYDTATLKSKQLTQQSREQRNWYSI